MVSQKAPNREEEISPIPLLLINPKRTRFDTIKQLIDVVFGCKRQVREIKVHSFCFSYMKQAVKVKCKHVANG